MADHLDGRRADVTSVASACSGTAHARSVRATQATDTTHHRRPGHHRSSGRGASQPIDRYWSVWLASRTTPRARRPAPQHGRSREPRSSDASTRMNEPISQRTRSCGRLPRPTFSHHTEQWSSSDHRSQPSSPSASSTTRSSMQRRHGRSRQRRRSRPSSSIDADVIVGQRRLANRLEHNRLTQWPGRRRMRRHSDAHASLQPVVLSRGRQPLQPTSDGGDQTPDAWRGPSGRIAGGDRGGGTDGDDRTRSASRGRVGPGGWTCHYYAGGGDQPGSTTDGAAAIMPAAGQLVLLAVHRRLRRHRLPAGVHLRPGRSPARASTTRLRPRPRRWPPCRWRRPDRPRPAGHGQSQLVGLPTWLWVANWRHPPRHRRARRGHGHRDRHARPTSPGRPARAATP